MIRLDKITGKLFYNENFVPSKFEKVGHTVNGDNYSNFKVDYILLNHIKVDFIAYYKNTCLDNISIFLDNDYLTKNYSPPLDLDYKDYLTPFVEHSINELRKILKLLIDSEKTHFEWGKIEILTDPRDRVSFIKISYNRNLNF